MDKIYFEEAEYPFFDKLKKCITLYVNISLALLSTLFLLRALELFYIIYTTQVPKELGSVIYQALFYDVLFFLKLLPYTFVIFLMVFFISRNKRACFWVYGVICTIFIMLYLSLVKYFETSLVPLGADLYTYSIKEIRETAGAGGNIEPLFIVIFIIPVAIFWFLANWFYKRQLLKPVYSIGILCLGAMILFMGTPILPANTSYSNDFSYNVALNKEAYFLEKSYNHFLASEPEVDIYAENYFEDETTDSVAGYKRFTYVNNQYPFLHKDETPDVLGNFFNIDSAKAPNIVFIQVEGLGRAYSGPNAYLGSFTPFLDALAKKSLYWENFLSSQGRTFASLPSILGSMPFGTTGYLDLGNKMPNGLTLLSILKKNGYGSRFYGGFDTNFDNEAIFFSKQGVSPIIGEANFGSGFSKSPANSGGFTWGYADKELFKRSIQLEQEYPKQPFISYVQTISMHTPYTIPNQQEYINLAEQQLVKLGFDEPTKAEHQKYIDKYSTVMYTDAAIQSFLIEYSKLPSYKNTIFIITGDHRLPEIPMSTKIDRYRVPLIIFSPLLKRSASFKSISSHLDITPSLLAFFKHNYKLNTPDVAPWVGSGLDTVKVLRNIHKYPLKQTKDALINYISGMYFIDQEVLFSIGDNLDIQPITDDGKMNELRTEFNQYKAMNTRFAQELKLIPDSLYNAYR